MPAISPTMGTPYAFNEYAIIPLGTQYADGTWREVRRDLDADLQSVFGVGVVYVRWVCIRGDYDLDDLTLFGESRSYYYAGSQRIALRQGNAVYYVQGDHLGSTSLTTDASGNKIAELRYRAYGETRYTWGNTPTDRRFTGRRSEEASLGSLYDYGARMYSPVLGRFLSADTSGQSAVAQQVRVYSRKSAQVHRFDGTS